MGRLPEMRLDQWVAQSMRDLYRMGYTTLSGGNVSRLGEDGRCYITPAGKDKGRLTVAQIAVFDLSSATRLKGNPSSEWPFHQAIYLRNPRIGAVLHSHPYPVVGLSLAPDMRIPSPFSFFSGLTGPVGFVPYAPPGSQVLAAYLAEAFDAGQTGVIMANHGLCVATPYPTTGLELTSTLVALALSSLWAGRFPFFKTGQPPSELGNWAAAAPATNRVRPIPSSISRLFARAFSRGDLSPLLSIIFLREGARSVRLFVRTPGQFREVCLDADHAAGLPAVLKQALEYFSSDPDISAGGFFLPPYTMALAWSGRPLLTNLIPETTLVVGKITQLTERNPVNFAGWLTHRRHFDSGYLGPDCGLFLIGKSPDQVLDRLEVTEASAKACQFAGRVNRPRYLPDREMKKFLANHKSGV